MEEVLDLADRITVLRDGRYVGDLTRAEATHEKIVAMMVGRELSDQYFPPKHEKQPGEPILVVNDLLVPGTPAGTSFTALRGEILGFAGLVGLGAHRADGDHLRRDAGARRHDDVGRRAVRAPSPARRDRRAGVYLAPEDRKRHGLVLPMSVAENTSLPNVGDLQPLGLARPRDRAPGRRGRGGAPAHQDAEHPPEGGEPVGRQPAEGGAGQMAGDEPQGADPRRADARHRRRAPRRRSTATWPSWRTKGITILMVSSDMEEIIGMSDRVVVMHERRIKGVLPRDRLTQERIATLMTGRTEGTTAA